MLEKTGIAPSTSISIAVAALILGKAVLIADMLPFINRFPHKPLIYNIAWKTVIYLLISADHSLSGTPDRFLARDRQLCRRQSKVTVANHLAAFLGHPDHSLRPHRRVLHGARAGARDRKRKGDADILRPDAGPGSVNEAAWVRFFSSFVLVLVVGH